MCKYCENKNNFSDIVIEDILNNGIYIVYLCRGNEKQPEDGRFDFCPMCGTPLGEVKPLTVEQLAERAGGTDLISDIRVNIQKDASVFSAAYMMAVDSCLNEILCTLPVLWNCKGRMSHITKTDNSGYHAVSLDGSVVAEFTITPLYSESSIAFERSIKYSAYADKVRQMASLGDCLDILKTEK